MDSGFRVHIGRKYVETFDTYKQEEQHVLNELRNSRVVESRDRIRIYIDINQFMLYSPNIIY